MARISADEASQIIAQQQRQLSQAVLPPTLNRIRLMMKEDMFPICNVGPWDYRLERAALHLYIPAYKIEEDSEKLGYAGSDPLPCVNREAKLVGGGGDSPLEYSWIEDDGRLVANDLIGIGFGLPAQNALTQYGVFVPAGPKPTKQELAEARRALSLYCDRLIAEARDAYDKGPEERKAVISSRHIWAATTRGIDEKWVHHQHSQESVRCEMCGRFNPSGIAMCGCGTILDFDLYRKIKAREEQMTGGAAPKK